MLIIGTKAKHFDLVRLLSERKQNILIWSKKIFIASKSFPFWPENSGTKQSNLIWSGNCLGQNRTFHYNPKTYRSKQNVMIWSTYYRNESKTFWFGPIIVQRKKKKLIWIASMFFCANADLKVHKIEIFFGFDFEIGIISLLVMSKY